MGWQPLTKHFGALFFFQAHLKDFKVESLNIKANTVIHMTALWHCLLYIKPKPSSVKSSLYKYYTAACSSNSFSAKFQTTLVVCCFLCFLNKLSLGKKFICKLARLNVKQRRSRWLLAVSFGSMLFAKAYFIAYGSERVKMLVHFVKLEVQIHRKYHNHKAQSSREEKMRNKRHICNHMCQDRSCYYIWVISDEICYGGLN